MQATLIWIYYFMITVKKTKRKKLIKGKIRRNKKEKCKQKKPVLGFKLCLFRPFGFRYIAATIGTV